MEINRKTEFVLGIIGGIVGIVAAISVMRFVSPMEYVSVDKLGFVALLFSIFGMIGASITKKNHLLGGTIMISAALSGMMLSITLANIISTVLFAIAGLMAVIRGGNFKLLLKKWWFYAVLVAQIIIPIIMIIPSPSYSNGPTFESHVSKVENTSPTDSQYDEAETTEMTPDEGTTTTTDKDEGTGTRSNPTPLNSTFMYSGAMSDLDTSEYFEASLDITVVETIRGEEALNLIKTKNKSTSPPPEGTEYILNKIKVKASNIIFPENEFRITNYDFNYLSGDGTAYNSDYIVIPDALEATLYDGDVNEGYIHSIINKDDDAPLIKFRQFYFKTK
ncbi:hypothetical protein HCJ02_01985 [Listeria seeligeri]|uniref:hypothetical protein n=1 Tax=Listeria TaxID=1637 RepID=UPI001626FEE3|nr:MULTISPECIES: hypothetical protein [Listeria]MBC1827082.1 hypothetical protein [Listeria seeligeri]MBC1840124.1 hypothetical protein [Listeria seeligeri]MBC6141869.1 hypothetical protein [Listeria seeligeri]MBC6302506.1 hypothetical protein [Listeria immobilis]